MILSSLYWCEVMKSYKKYDISLTEKLCKDDIIFKSRLCRLEDIYRLSKLCTYTTRPGDLVLPDPSPQNCNKAILLTDPV